MAKNSSTKGAKKSRRFGRKRSDVAKAKCAARKAARREAQAKRESVNRERGRTAWEDVKQRRYNARH